MKPLSPELETYVAAEVKRLRITAVPCKVAPKLTDAFVTDKGEWRIYVWAGASSRTIWSSPAANWAFRAWHDSTHIETGLGLDPASEMELAKRVCTQARLGDALSEGACKVLYAETAGQIEHYLRHAGAFPENQRAFVKAYAAGTWKGEKY